MLSPINRLKAFSTLNGLKPIRFQSRFTSLLIFSTSKDQPSQFSFRVPKRLDKRATRRNRTRRLLQESILFLIPEIKPSYIVIVSAQKILWDTPFEDVQKDMKEALVKANLLIAN